MQRARVRGDEPSLGQVVRNLVDNAARHATLAVAVAVHEADDAVELVVEDDGPGVPEDQRERVFERFVRLDEARARDDGGSGLGLAIVEEIVRAHGGSVAVSSVGAGRCAVRRTASARGRASTSLNALSGAFRGASARSLQGGHDTAEATDRKDHS